MHLLPLLEEMHRERDRDRDRQTDRQREADRQADKERERERESESERETERERERERDVVAGCLTSQQHASLSQGRICSDSFTCCHTEEEVADRTAAKPSTVLHRFRCHSDINKTSS